MDEGRYRVNNQQRGIAFRDLGFEQPEVFVE
jgi:hypothetical protein